MASPDSCQRPPHLPLDSQQESHNSANMAKLLQLLGSIKGIFAQYAGKDGDGRSLSKRELSELLREEFGITGSANKKELDDFFDTLDQDKDNVVDYNEFLTFMVTLVAIMDA
ncbi:protein S100-A6-like [Cynoglossus semilaevis]|uniref:Protein S100 n=2 Tax=Cynoglossus semilaevis TaxID=244447 RepID=A0A3P8UJI1_CYNSE|nr:protein S100-A6-like [Cynoglossus semilaevis]